MSGMNLGPTLRAMLIGNLTSTTYVPTSSWLPVPSWVLSQSIRSCFHADDDLLINICPRRWLAIGSNCLLLMVRHLLQRIYNCRVLIMRSIAQAPWNRTCFLCCQLSLSQSANELLQTSVNHNESGRRGPAKSFLDAKLTSFSYLY